MENGISNAAAIRKLSFTRKWKSQANTGNLITQKVERGEYFAVQSETATN